jgi:hypothetical protein
MKKEIIIAVVTIKIKTTSLHSDECKIKCVSNNCPWFNSFNAKFCNECAC